MNITTVVGLSRQATSHTTHRAQLSVCTHALDLDDARMLLDMLGLRGPIDPRAEHDMALPRFNKGRK